jgi:hypothetical protein
MIRIVKLTMEGNTYSKEIIVFIIKILMNLSYFEFQVAGEFVMYENKASQLWVKNNSFYFF